MLTTLRLLILAVAVSAPASVARASDVWFVHQDAAGAANGQSWIDAFTDLQMALAVADAGDQVWVAGGTYRPDEAGLDPTKVFSIPAGVSLFGGFAGFEITLTQRDTQAYSTTLDGDLLQDDLPGFVNYADNSEVVVLMEGVGPAAVLDGFSVRGGTGRHTPLGTALAAGVWIKNGQAALTNCTIAENRGGPYGAAGGIAVHASASVKLVACLLTDNRTELGNGGAVNAHGGANVVAINCRFASNWSSAGGGAVALYQSSGTFMNCLFTDNRTDVSGGAIQSFSSVVDIVHCTIANNHGLASGGGIAVADPGPVRIANCVLWDNIIDGGNPGLGWDQVAAGFETTIDSCCVQPPYGYGGSNNIVSDPQFADPLGPDLIASTADDDYRLKPTSPCIDAGTNQIFAPDVLDLDCDGMADEPMPVDRLHAPRYVDQIAIDTGIGPPPISDIGAYEYSGWSHLGYALEGAGGVVPCATGGGDWIPGREISLDIRRGPPGGLAAIVLSSSIAKLPFKGGVLVPAPEDAFVTVLDAQGHVPLSNRVPMVQPLGSLIVLQPWFLDPGAPFGASAAPAFSGLVHP